MKVNDRVTIKDKIWNKDFHSGEKSRKRKPKIFRIDFFMPSGNSLVKLKNDNGSSGTMCVNIEDLEIFPKEEEK